MYLDRRIRFTLGIARVFSAAFIVKIFVGSLAAQELFPIPPQLQDNVEFWTKVYAQYSETEVVIHDAEYLNIIYETVKLSDYFDENISTRIQWRKVERVKDEYVAILNKLGRLRQPIDPALLSEKELRVYNLWAGVTDADKFSRAAANVRGQKGLRERFKLGLERSGRYMAEIQDVFQRYGLPTELGYLPHVESSFNYKAYSKMGAAGIWQFTRSTGRLFMQVDYSVDERLDPSIATDAAARLLRKNYSELGSWPLAITAYNHGLEGMKRAKTQVGTDDMGIIADKYKSRSFGFASRNFYAEFLAAKQIAQNYETYYGAINFEPAARYHTFEVPDYVTLDILASKFRLDKETIAQLNPALRPPVVKSNRRIPQGYKLRLPALPDFDPSGLYAQMPEAEKHEQQVRDRYYKVQPGDNLGSIARQVGVRVDELMVLNDIRDPRRLREGQLLELPGAAKESEMLLLAENTPVALPTTQTETLGGGLEPAPPPILSPTSTLAPAPALAQSDQTEPSSLADLIPAREAAKPANPILDSESTTEPAPYGPEPLPEFYERFVASVAASLNNPSWAFEVDFEEPQGEWIVVQPEETLGHYAEWLQVPTQRLRMENHLPFGQEIQVGRRLRLVLTQTTTAEFHRRRLEYHRAIQEDFFGSYKLDGIKKYTIQDGDNIWGLCQRSLQIPYWLLIRYNKNRELLRLHPGDEIDVPVVVAINKELADNQTE